MSKCIKNCIPVQEQHIYTTIMVCFWRQCSNHNTNTRASLDDQSSSTRTCRLCWVFENGQDENNVDRHNPWRSRCRVLGPSGLHHFRNGRSWDCHSWWTPSWSSLRWSTHEQDAIKDNQPHLRFQTTRSWWPTMPDPTMHCVRFVERLWLSFLQQRHF